MKDRVISQSNEKERTMMSLDTETPPITPQQYEVLHGGGEETPMLKKSLMGLIVCMLLTLLFAACTIGNAGATAGPTVHMGVTNFLQHSVTIHKGDKLTLVDDASSEHIITNGSWIKGVGHPAKEPGAPMVNQQFNGNDSATIGPFNTAGIFHLYCTIHQNMNLTVTVQ